MRELLNHFTMPMVIIAFLLFAILSFRSPSGSDTPEYTEYEAAVWMLKSQEGLRLTPYSDGRQQSIGYGTKAEGRRSITHEQAQQDMHQYFVTRHAEIVDQYPSLSRRQALVLTAFSYNVGSFGPEMHKAAISGSDKRIAKAMKKYVMFKGKKNAGLLKRRSVEIDLLLASDRRLSEMAETFRQIVISDVSSYSQ
jgi:GH24 family phage-related lysozyme (muramidase)